MPVFTHAATDLDSFRLFTSQLIVNGTATETVFPGADLRLIYEIPSSP